MTSECDGEAVGDDGEEDESKASDLSDRGIQGDKGISISRVPGVREKETDAASSLGVCEVLGAVNGVVAKAGGAEFLAEAVVRSEVSHPRDFSDHVKKVSAKSDVSGDCSFGRRPVFLHPSSLKARSGGGKLADFQGWNFNVCTTLFVNNIPPLSSSSKLKAWFGNFGSVVDVFIPKKRSKFGGVCFAFVRFWNEDEALLACEKVDGSVFDGFVLDVNISKYPRLPLQPRSVSCSGIKDAGGFSLPLSGDKPANASMFSACSSGAMSAGVNRGSISAVCSRFESGVSFAQILKSRGGLYGNHGGRADVSGRLARSEENFDHLQAVLNKSSGLEVVPVRSFCVSDLLADSFEPSSKDEGPDLSSLRAVPSGMLADDPGVVDSCLGDEKVGRDADKIRVSVRKPESHLEEVGVIELGNSSSCEMSRSSDAVGEQCTNSIAEEAKVQEVEEDEEAPMSAEEKAEIKVQVRAIIHDALRIGKAMGINITPRDARMIKRFASLQAFR